ncbi:MAG: ribokinase [Limnochordales bacterium]|nr:ribokinase [Limnochordales bacterium]
MDLVVEVERAPIAGETIIGRAFRQVAGGKGANQAQAAARLGAEVKLVGRVGQDSLGETRLAALRAEGIDTSRVIRDSAHPTGVALITVEADGQNRIVVVPGANEAVSPSDIASAIPLFAWADMVVVQLEIPLEAVDAALSTAAAHRVPVLLNPAPAPATSLPDSWWPRISLLVPNQTEAATLTGIDTGSPAGIEQAARQLLGMGAGAVIITAGASGAYVLSRPGSAGAAPAGCWIPAFPVSPVDTVGAGDAFCGALATRLAMGDDLLAAARYASATAAIAITRPGASDSLPRADEVEQFLATGLVPPPAAT